MTRSTPRRTGLRWVKWLGLACVLIGGLAATAA
jgi:hypothetical protein